MKTLKSRQEKKQSYVNGQVYKSPRPSLSLSLKIDIHGTLLVEREEVGALCWHETGLEQVLVCSQTVHSKPVSYWPKQVTSSPATKELLETVLSGSIFVTAWTNFSWQDCKLSYA
jgi:hypothetical protein